MRIHAEMAGLSPSSVSRYLSGQVLPSEEFIEDLVDAVERQTGQSLPEELDRLRKLLYAAQDTSTGTWNHLKRLQERARRADEKTAVLQEQNTELHMENQMLQQRLDLALHTMVQSDVLTAAQDRISSLELESASLRAKVAALLGEETVSHPGWRPHDYLASHSYWNSHASTLLKRGWTASSVALLDRTTSSILEQLPSQSLPSPSPARGLVQLLPQAGKTTNVVGTVAKAADAGYRLIIVIAGTVDASRRQLQTSLDEGLPSSPGTPGITRLTDQTMDYRRLRARLFELDFEKKDPKQPFNSPDNLAASPVRLMVVKRNSAVLRKLLDDLKAVPALHEVPTLVIDSETAAVGGIVDRLVGLLLDTLPRADYLAFSTQLLIAGGARSPGDPLAPADFVITPQQPPGYFGPLDLFGREGSENAGTLVRRRVSGAPGLYEALDMFVLTGAMKLYRTARGAREFSQHLMMVGTGALSQVEYEDLLNELRELWDRGDYRGPEALERLRQLFYTDVLPTSRLLTETEPTPKSFDELLPHLSAVVDRTRRPLLIGGVYDIPTEPLWAAVVVTNKATEHVSNDGLTVLFVHSTNQRLSEAILTSTGKLFGFRPGYADLVRLYLPEPEPGADGTDLYAALTTAWASEIEMIDEWKQ